MIGPVVYNKLTADNRLTGVQVSPAITGQELTMPAITYVLGSIAPNDTKDGVSRLDQEQFSCIVFDKDYAKVQYMAQVTRDILDRFCGTVEGIYVQSIQFNGYGDSYDQGAEMYGVTLDFTARVVPAIVPIGGIYDYSAADYSNDYNIAS